MKSLDLIGVTQWKACIKRLRKAQSLALQMMAHPDVTPE